MKKFIFDFITSSFSLFENPFYNYIAMFVVGSLAFSIAWNIVGNLGFRGEIGSIFHWVIRLISFIFIWIVFTLLINFVLFVLNNWKLILMLLIILLIILVIIKLLKKRKEKYRTIKK